jgi:hypothetical protein
MHLNEGEIRAYQDNALDVGLHQQVQAHLEVCSRCQALAAELLARSQRVENHLASLHPEAVENHTPPHIARAQLEARLTLAKKEHETMSKKLFNRLPRIAWVGLALVLVLAISMAFAPVRAIANSFLGLFRVEQIQVVEFDPDSLPDQSNSASQLEQMLSENAQFESMGDPQEVNSAAEASAMIDIPVRLPAAVDGDPKLTVQPGGHIALNVDLELVRSVLKDIGRSDIKLPADLDGAKIEIDIPSGVAAAYGDCDVEPEDGFDPDEPRPMPSVEQSGCIVVLQMASPTISAPPGLNVAQIGEAYLQLLGMSREDAESFSQNVDWTTTFIIPLPRYSTEYTEIQVDGVTGTWIKHIYSKLNILMWVKDGIVYTITGTGQDDLNTLLEMAGSLH